MSRLTGLRSWPPSRDARAKTTGSARGALIIPFGAALRCPAHQEARVQIGGYGSGRHQRVDHALYSYGPVRGSAGTPSAWNVGGYR